jgi:hypothetical protein
MIQFRSHFHLESYFSPLFCFFVSLLCAVLLCTVIRPLTFSPSFVNVTPDFYLYISLHLLLLYVHFFHITHEGCKFLLVLRLYTLLTHSSCTRWNPMDYFSVNPDPFAPRPDDQGLITTCSLCVLLIISPDDRDT